MMVTIALMTSMVVGMASDKIVTIDPPEQGFYSKMLDDDGIPIKAHKDVVDEALIEAKRRLKMMMAKLANVHKNLVCAGANLHIIGRNQVTSDLPEYNDLKGKPFDGKLTVDERTRGLGGLSTSCGEENLLKLENDRYKGRDICVHEFAHNIYRYGVPSSVRKTFREQMKKSLDKGLWVGAYSASNEDEFFAELSMWYFGTRGDLNMKGEKPKDGKEGFKAYDPEAFALFDKFYSGKIKVGLMKPRKEGE
jgi:hypothetical protein